MFERSAGKMGGVTAKGHRVSAIDMGEECVRRGGDNQGASVLGTQERRPRGGISRPRVPPAPRPARRVVSPSLRGLVRPGGQVIRDLLEFVVADFAARDRGHMADALARDDDHVGRRQVVARLEQRRLHAPRQQAGAHAVWAVAGDAVLDVERFTTFCILLLEQREPPWVLPPRWGPQ